MWKEDPGCPGLIHPKWGEVMEEEGSDWDPTHSAPFSELERRGRGSSDLLPLLS